MPEEDIAPVYEILPNQPPGRGIVGVNKPQRGAEHFVAWGLAIDQALQSMSGSDPETKSLSFSAEVEYYETAGEDPGWVTKYGAEFS